MTNHGNPSPRFMDRLNELQRRLADGETHLVDHYKKELRHCLTQLHRLDDDPELRDFVEEVLQEQMYEAETLSDEDLCRQIALTYEATNSLYAHGDTLPHIDPTASFHHPNPSSQPDPLIQEQHGFSILGCLYVIIALLGLSIAAGVLIMIFFLPR